MDEFLDDMDDEQVDDLLMPEEDETSSSQMYEHFRFVADKGQSLLRVDKFLVDRMMGATRNRIQLAAEAGCMFMEGGNFIEENEPKEFFEHPKSERLKAFLSKVL